MYRIRRRLEHDGFTTAVTNVMLQSRRESSVKQYGPHIQSWERFCAVKKVDSVRSTVALVLECLQTLFDKGLGYSTVNTAKSAVSAVITLLHNQTLGLFPQVKWDKPECTA